VKHCQFRTHRHGYVSAISAEIPSGGGSCRNCFTGQSMDACAAAIFLPSGANRARKRDIRLCRNDSCKMTERRVPRPSPRACRGCGRVFVPQRSHAVTCSETCRQRYHRQCTSNPILAQARQSVRTTRADAAEVAKIVAAEKHQPRIVPQHARELLPSKRRGGAEFVEVPEAER
jgi:hypothetical protein